MKRLIMKSLMQISALTILLSAPIISALADEDPSALVNNTSQQVREILMAENGENTAEIREQAKGVIYPRFDFLRMTALAVGRPWRNATDSEKEALIAEFRELLTSTYFNTMLKYRDAEVSIKPNVLIEREGKEATVKTSVTTDSGAEPVMIDYVLYRSDEGWKVFNVNVEGASLVTVYRNQFGEEISKGGINQLIDVLKNKNQSINLAQKK